MRWIDSTLAIAIHDRQLAEHGGASGVRDENLLESALARPQQMFAYSDSEPDLADLASALAHGIARNRPFVDGNKRTAMVTCETFIDLNGGTLYAEDVELFSLFLELAEGQLSTNDFAAWLRSRLRPMRVQEPQTGYGARKRKSTARKLVGRTKG